MKKIDLYGNSKIFLVVFSLITKVKNFVKLQIFIGYPSLIFYFTKIS